MRGGIIIVSVVGQSSGKERKERWLNQGLIDPESYQIRTSILDPDLSSNSFTSVTRLRISGNGESQKPSRTLKYPPKFQGSALLSTSPPTCSTFSRHFHNYTAPGPGEQFCCVFKP
jgi:hypothetical protein